MLTGSAMLGPQELFATVTIGGRGSEAKHVQYPLQRGPPTQVHGHCGISGIEAKLLVGDDARWFPSAFPALGSGVRSRRLICRKLRLELQGVSIISLEGCSHIYEANMGQTSLDRRVILRGLGFGWWEGGELILSRSFVGPSPSPPSSPLDTPLH